MYVRQHPTYRRLSAHFTKSNRGAYNDRQQHRQTRRDDSHAATSHDFTSWERIGRGGFGKVYRVRPRHPSRYPDLPSSGYLAIKIVDKRALKDSAAEQRLAAEVAIHECLDHPSIVRIYDSFEDDRLVYIVMEYCAGGDLWRYLRQRHLHASQLPNSEGAPQLSPLSEAEARHVMRQVSSAVAYLHSLGVLHRDLKLANMMLSENMDVKVGDFGLATWIRGDNTMEPTTLCGTPSYISPEILARQPYSFESDIWALGCLFVTLLTGSQPFRGSGRITEEAVAQIRLPSDISQEARRLIRALLRIDPRRRIRSSELPDHPFFTSLRSPSTRLPTLSQLDAQAHEQRLRHTQNRRILRHDDIENEQRGGRSKQQQQMLPPRHPDILSSERHGREMRVLGGRGAYEGHSDDLLPPPESRVASDDLEVASRHVPPPLHSSDRRRRQEYHSDRGNGRGGQYLSAGMPSSSRTATDTAAAMGGPHYRPHSADITYTRAGHYSNENDNDNEGQQQQYMSAQPTSQRTGPASESRARQTAQEPFSQRHGSQEAAHGSKAVDLSAFSTRRLQPMKRAMKNGKIYLRADRLLILDLTSSPTLIAMDESSCQVYEFKRPLHLDSLTASSAYRTHPWDLHQMPPAVSKSVRIACRCVAYLLSQQKRIKVSTPQGKGWLFEDAPLAGFKFSFFNGIKVEIARRRGEATVEIPSKEDLPNEIQKIPLSQSEFPHTSDGEGGGEANDIPLDFSDLSMQRRQQPSSADGGRVPEKIRGILAHAKEALKRVLEFNAVLAEFEEGGAMYEQYEGSIVYPVNLSWDWDSSNDMSYVPPGLTRRRQASRRAGQQPVSAVADVRDRGGMPMSISNTVGSSTAVASNGNGNSRRTQEMDDRMPQSILSRQYPDINHHHNSNSQQPAPAATPYVGGQKQRWDVHVLDRRTVDDTPTRRLNMGPITRLVEEFNQPNTRDASANDRRYQQQQWQQQKFLRTPGSLLRTPAARSNRGSNQAHVLVEQGFEDACFIPDVGWCLLALGGDGEEEEDCLFTMLFCDGCKVLVRQKAQSISFKDAAAEYTDLPIGESLPVRVKERIMWLPQFLPAMGFVL